MKLNEIKLGKLNVFDMAIILVVVIFVSLFASNLVTGNEENSIETGTSNIANNTFVYTISIESLSDTSADMIKIGDEVYDKIANTYIGKIKELEITEAQGLLEKENGEVIRATVPGKIDVKMTIETEGNIKNGEYLANGLIRIMVGNEKQIKTKYLMCSGKISSIER